MNNIFVGNLSFQATKEDVIKLFEPFGLVANAVIMERKKGKSRGYGFVDMPNEEQKNAAIAALQGKEFMWRVLSVSCVIPKVKGESKSKKFKPAKKNEKTSGPKPYRKEERNLKSENTSESASKYYSKLDGPPKPWRKVSPGLKLSHKNGKGSRPYYGKKDSADQASKNKPSKGFKMFHKVSRASKTGPKKERPLD